MIRRHINQCYVASCPFCAYRAVFVSEFGLIETYHAHLREHEKESAIDGESGRQTARDRIRNVAEHMQRLEAARYN